MSNALFLLVETDGLLPPKLCRDPEWRDYQQNQPQAAPGSIFMPPPSSKLGARHKNKNPTGNPIGLILLWELLDSNQ